MVQNGQHFSNITQTDPKWPKMVYNGLKLSLVQNSPKWSNMVQFLSTKSSSLVQHNHVYWTSFYLHLFNLKQVYLGMYADSSQSDKKNNKINCKKLC